jgi:DNA-binding transcriptional LysR family regulator
MEPLSAIEAFVRSAEGKSFSAAARKLGLSPAAVSKSVAKLEDTLGVRLFQRTTRRITLTEAGERLFAEAAPGLESLQTALTRASGARMEPAGLLKVSVAPSFGREYVLPMLQGYVAAHPKVNLDWDFRSQQVDLIGEGFDAAIGVGLELGAGIVTRELARIHVIAVASKDYLDAHGTPRKPEQLAEHDGVVFRSSQSGRIRTWPLQNASGAQAIVEPRHRVVFNDAEAVCTGAVNGLGIGLVATPFALPHLEAGRLVRVLPGWFSDAGPMLIYFASQKLLPLKTRAFVDHVVAHFKKERLAQRFRADR